MTINAMTTPDHVAKAQQLIGHTITTVIDSITQAELEAAKQVILNEPADWYSTNRSIAATYLWLQRHGFGFDFVAQRAAHIRGITLDQVKAAARTWLKPDKLAVVQVGRVQAEACPAKP